MQFLSLNIAQASAKNSREIVNAATCIVTIFRSGSFYKKRNAAVFIITRAFAKNPF